LPAGLDTAVQTLARLLNLEPSQIRVILAEPVEWSDACLGVAVVGRLCAQVVTPGYRVVLEAQGKQYEFHTNNSGTLVVLASAPKPSVGTVDILWQSPDQPCQAAEIGAYGIAVGECGGALVQGLFASAERVNELKAFVSTYQSFSSTTVAGGITFNGLGNKPAMPAEQRSIAEWAALVHAEVIGSRSGAAWGSAFVWHREGGIAGFCDDLTVYRDGFAVASSCRSSTGVFLGNFRLNAVDLERLYKFLDTYQAGGIDRQDNPGGVDSMTVTMTFAGIGQQALDEAARQELVAFASSLFNAIPQVTPTP